MLTVTVTPSSQQYSDKVDLSATVVLAPPIGGNGFYINYGTGTQQLLGTVAVAANSAGTVTGAALLETVAGSMNPAAYVVTAVFPERPERLHWQREYSVADYHSGGRARDL